MNKDLFWQIIDSVNLASVNKDRESRVCLAVESLLQYSLEDIMDWQLILNEYSRAAFRNDLVAASAPIRAYDTHDSFIDFGFWLISCGKGAFMSALRNPDSLAAVPLNGEAPYFEAFGYIAYRAYEAKLFHIDPNRPEDLFKALKTHTLDPQTIKDIQDELLQRADISPEQCARIISRASLSGSMSQEPEDIKGLLNTLNLAYGYVYKGNQCMEYVFFSTPEHIAYFIGSRLDATKIIVTNAMDSLILSTIGCFIDRCPDQDLLREITKTLIPIQIGEAEAQPFFCPTRAEVEEYCEKEE